MAQKVVRRSSRIPTKKRLFRLEEVQEIVMNSNSEFDLTSEDSDVSRDGSSLETETAEENEDVAQILRPI